MSEEVAPYGGYIIKSLEDEKINEQKLKDESIEVIVDGETQIIRPEAIRLNGVDNLSTNEIKSYIEYYINYTTRQEESIESETEEVKVKTVYDQLPFDQQLTFRVEWIDDSSTNIVFKTSEDCKKSLINLIEQSINLEVDYLDQVIHPKPAKSYQPIIEFRKQQDLSSRLGLEKEEKPKSDETLIELTIRQSFQSDRKIKNASQYSRYYLIHGEPERKPRRRYRESYIPKPRTIDNDDEDLFADKLSGRISEPAHKSPSPEEEDLFADKLKQRERSPTRKSHTYRQR